MPSWEEKQRLLGELAAKVRQYQAKVAQHNERVEIADNTANSDGRRSPLQDGIRDDVATERDEALAEARAKQGEIHKLEKKVRSKKTKQGELLEGAPDEPEPEPEGEPQSELDFNKKKKRERKKKKDKRQTKLNLERTMRLAAAAKATHEAGKKLPSLGKLLKLGVKTGARFNPALNILMTLMPMIEREAKRKRDTGA
jgi:hypothetical protein